MPNRVLLALASRPAVRRLVTTRRIAGTIVDRFVAGDTLDEAMRVAHDLKRSGIAVILDYLGENVSTEAGADAAASAYAEALRRIASEGTGSHISVKLTQLGLDLSARGALGRIEKLCVEAGEAGTTVAIDMESHEYTDRTIEVYRALKKSHQNVVLCLQAYLRRTPADVQSLLPLGPRVRLCKGAYNEPKEIALSKRQTNQAFRSLLEVLLTSCDYTAIATHDETLVTEALRITRAHGIPIDRYEFQMLYGVRRQLQGFLAGEGYQVRVYVPYGDQWYPYLTRRLAERPANLRLLVEALIRG